MGLLPDRSVSSWIHPAVSVLFSCLKRWHIYLCSLSRLGGDRSGHSTQPTCEVFESNDGWVPSPREGLQNRMAGGNGQCSDKKCTAIISIMRVTFICSVPDFFFPAFTLLLKVFFYNHFQITNCDLVLGCIVWNWIKIFLGLSYFNIITQLVNTFIWIIQPRDRCNQLRYVNELHSHQVITCSETTVCLATGKCKEPRSSPVSNCLASESLEGLMKCSVTIAAT